jgi:hypothetical protein
VRYIHHIQRTPTGAHTPQPQTISSGATTIQRANGDGNDNDDETARQQRHQEYLSNLSMKDRLGQNEKEPRFKPKTKGTKKFKIKTNKKTNKKLNYLNKMAKVALPILAPREGYRDMRATAWNHLHWLQDVLNNVSELILNGEFGEAEIILRAVPSKLPQLTSFQASMMPDGFARRLRKIKKRYNKLFLQLQRSAFHYERTPISTNDELPDDDPEEGYLLEGLEPEGFTLR